MKENIVICLSIINSNNNIKLLHYPLLKLIAECTVKMHDIQLPTILDLNSENH